MKILAMDTSAVTATIAAADDNKILGEISFTTSLTHSQTIMPMIDYLLGNLSLSVTDFDLFACSNGPGSFTGLRIGLGTIKGLAYGAGKDVTAVSTLEALAYNIAFTDFVVAPIMDARRGEVYNAMYKFENGVPVCIREPRALSVSHLAREINTKTVFVGDGVLPHREKLSEYLGDNALFAPPNLCLQRAASVAAAAFNHASVKAEEISAVYLRKSQAERELEKNNIKD